MKYLSLFILLLISTAYAVEVDTLEAADSDNANIQNIYVVANSNISESVETAKYYALKRGLNLNNIIAIPMPDATQISDLTYFAKVENPIIDELANRGAISIHELDLPKKPDARKKRIFFKSNVDFIVICKGVPLKIAPKFIETLNPDGKKTRKQVRNGAGVDSTLAAALMPNSEPFRKIKNPLFGNLSKNALHRIIPVLRTLRIDAPSYKAARAMIDSALYAEQYGLRGRVYIDKSKKYKAGDDWLEEAKNTFASMDFDVSENTSAALFGYYERFDAPAIYLGWYARKPAFYFAENGFKFPEGAIALHIFSYSADSLASTANWTAKFADCNAASTFGNVFEPYLDFTHHPNILASAIAANLNMGEASYASIPLLNWMNVSVGDPLYLPLKTNLDSQLANIELGKIDSKSQYSVIRKMNLIQKQSGDVAALQFGMQFVGKIPHTALLWKLLSLAKSSPDSQLILNLSNSLLNDPQLLKNPDLKGLAFEVADMLQHANGLTEAMLIYSRLEENSTSDNFSRALVAKALAVSKKGAKVPENIRAKADAFERQRIDSANSTTKK